MYCRCERADCHFCHPLLPPLPRHSSGDSEQRVYDDWLRLARCGARVRLGILQAGQLVQRDVAIQVLQERQQTLWLITDTQEAIPLEHVIMRNGRLLENPWSQQGAIVHQLAQHYGTLCGQVMSVALTPENVYRLDLSPANTALQGVHTADPAAFGAFLQRQLQRHNAVAAVGGYAERRLLYARSPALYGAGEKARCIHLGLDIWMPAGTAIHCPLDGVVHSVADHARPGDYGPTVIFEHRLDGVTFYTLYGHLSRSALRRLRPGQVWYRGEAFATLGSHAENGAWPAHLHYQWIAHLLGHHDDFPGVSRQCAQAFYLSLCPPPPLAALAEPG